MSRPNGYLLYRGPSQINGAPIIVVITGTGRKSKNAKTGDMLQTWIMLEDIAPTKASQAKLDSAVCGECPLRQSLGGSCYVTLHQGPLSVWKAYHRGNYPIAGPVELAQIRSRNVRVGSYGDPAAAPKAVWDAVLPAPNHTGYTHQWRTADHLRGMVMASVDNPLEMMDAWAKGWRTFRVARSFESVLPGEVECPATTNGTNCADCGLCKGAGKAKSIVIRAHGARSKRFDSLAVMN